jgi:protein-S-isoprenylcysteine O-methyltransferase Ste14
LQLTPVERAPDNLTRLGGWLFKHRTSLPVPIVLVLVIVPPRPISAPLTTTWMTLGILLVAIGELIRFWAVHHIGAISRTRSDRLGPLIDSGPFSLVRNPLYLGNILLWIGFALSAQLIWFVPIVLVLLALEYHAIVRWEERLLESRIGTSYVAYLGRVPRWIPKGMAPKALDGRAPFSWKETIFSERGTLIAIAAGYALLMLKAADLGAALQ